MDRKPTLSPGQALRRLFGLAPGANLSHPLYERRSLRMPVMVERRRGPRCENCGFGTMHPVPSGCADAGLLSCDGPGCGAVTDMVASNARECIIRAS